MEEIVNNAIHCLASQYLQLRYLTTTEVLGNGNNVIIIYVSSSVNCLWYTEKDETVYVLDNNVAIPATITQIESLVQENTLCELSNLEQKNMQTISNVGTQLLSITNTIEKHELIQDIMFRGVPLLSIYNLTAHTSAKLTEEMNTTYFRKNGLPHGNIYFVEKNQIRLDDTILRYSCPVTNVPDNILERFDNVELSSVSIVISQYGGMHITTSNKKILGKETNYLILEPKEDEPISPYVILAWFKSSLFTWYVYKRYNTTNIYLPKILRDIVVPYEILTDLSDKLKEIVQKILAKEERFLSEAVTKDFYKECRECKECADEYCAIERFGKEHNTYVDQKTKEIDQLFFDIFDIDEDKQDFIKKDLEAANIYNII